MPPLDSEHHKFFSGFVEEIRSDLGATVETESDRFPSRSRLLTRFDESATRLLENGLEALDAFQESHNEVCTAVAILEESVEPRCEKLDYEPSMDCCDKRFDFRVDFGKHGAVWVEVKTIHPKPLDGWDRYAEAVEARHFPDNAQLILDHSWLGGELFHKYFSARAKILSYTLATEEKVAQCLEPANETVCLAFFSNGFDWHIEDLEDFLYFYRHGKHYDGDHFRLMEEHHIAQNQINLRRNINHFGYIKRPSTEVRPVGGTWSVKPFEWPPKSPLSR